MITLDDGKTTKKLSDFGFREVTDHSNPAQPNFERKTVSIPGKSGVWEFGAQIGERSIVIPVRYLAMNEKEFEEKINIFNSFCFDRYGKPKDLKLVFDYEGEKFYKVKIEQNFIPNRANILKAFDLIFVASDPFKFAQSYTFDPEKPVYYNEVLSGDFYFNTKGFDFKYKKHYSSVFNHSSLNTDLKITLIGKLTQGSITHLQSGKKLTIPNTDKEESVIVIDTKLFDISIDGDSNVVGSNFNFFDLIPGDNGFLFEAENPNLKVEFQWFHKFL